MNKLVLFGCVGVLFFGCNKFEHTSSLELPTSCKICGYADQLTGTYDGQISGITYAFKGPNMSYSAPPTQMTVHLEHIFLDKGQYIDSTIMYIKMTSIFPEYGDTTSRILSFENLSGDVTNSYLDNFRLTPDSMYVYDSFYSKYGGNIVSTKYIGLRQ